MTSYTDPLGKGRPTRVWSGKNTPTGGGPGGSSGRLSPAASRARDADNVEALLDTKLDSKLGAKLDEWSNKQMAMFRSMMGPLLHGAGCET